MLGKQLIQAAAGSAAAGGGLYVDDVFSTFLYPGSSSAQTISNGIDLSTEGGLVWLKARTNNYNHALMDSERNWSGWLESNSNNPSQGGTFISPNTDGFTFSSGSLFFNGDPYDYTSWTFRKAPGFFDICEWTGNSVSGRQIAHNLGSAPGFIMVKSYVAGTGGTGWMCYHRSLGNTKAIRMDNGTGETTASSAYWNNTDPTSTHFTVGNHEDINTSDNSRSYIAYVFAHDSQVFGTDSDEAIIKCGTYSGNGSPTGPVIDLGFEPQWLMIKRSNTSGNWAIYDNMRGPGTPSNTILEANQPQTEDVNAVYDLDFQPTGFQLKNSSASLNGSGQTFIYMAIRRPHKPPTAGTEVFKVTQESGVSGGSVTTTTGFPVDLNFSKGSTTDNWWWTNRIRGETKLLTSVSNATETTTTTYTVEYDNSTGIVDKNYGQVSGTFYSYSLRRAPGFMDILSYEGNATAGTSHNHNLEAVPEFIICKSYDAGGGAGWWCYHKDLSTNYAIRLDGATNGSVGQQSVSNYWNSSTHSATTFTLGDYGDLNGSGKTFLAFLFATLSNVSKVGSYLGTGNAVNVDCGFSSGARYILIKRKDTSANWFVYDATRGIVSGNDPYSLFNTNATQVTNTDYVDPLTSGFTVTSSAPTGLNASGGTYIFLAIA